MRRGSSSSSAAFLAYAFVELYSYYQSAICLIPLDSFTVSCSETLGILFFRWVEMHLFKTNKQTSFKYRPCIYDVAELLLCVLSFGPMHSFRFSRHVRGKIKNWEQCFEHLKFLLCKDNGALKKN